jgi:hypothetical protein
MLLLALIACHAPELPVGSVVDEDWGVPTSAVSSPLDVGCAGALGGDGPYDVAIDDRTGWTVLVERSAGRVWLRDPFGIVADTCWWLPLSGTAEPLPSGGCVTGPDSVQNGACTPEMDVPDGFRFVTPGLADLGASIASAAPVDGTVLALANGALQRLDLTMTAEPPIDPAEGVQSWLGWLPALHLPSDDLADGRLAVAGDAVMLAGDDAWFFLPSDARTALGEPLDRDGAPRGPFVVAAAGDSATVVSAHGARVWSGLLDELKPEDRDHPALRDGVLAAAIDPTTDEVFALVPDGVVRLGADGAVAFNPTPGAEGLFLGWPAGNPTVYAWGNDADGGVLWRLDDASVAFHLDDRLLGAGTGVDFAEIAIVTAGNDGVPRVSGLLDHRHLDAIAPGSVGLAAAVFVETPRDPDLFDDGAATREMGVVGGCPISPVPGLTSETTLCCAQELRGQAIDRELGWLDQRLDGDDPLAVVLSVNPSAIHASALCAAVDDPVVSELGDTLPDAVSRWTTAWEARGVGTAAVFGHSGFASADAGWVTCPTEWGPFDDGSCLADATAEGFQGFYDHLAAAASLAPHPQPDFTLFAGGYGPDASMTGVIGWPDVLPGLVLPDGSPAEDGLFFGNLSMNPRLPSALDKELSPEDARLRSRPVELHSPADVWDSPGAAARDGVYWPGQTFALPYLYESRRAGLIFEYYVQYVAPNALAVDDPVYDGVEDPDVMSAADFAVEQQYLVSRVLGSVDTSGTRWTYFHVGDVSRLRINGFESGWIACHDDACTDTALDDFAARIAEWPAFRWTPRPPSE